MTEADDAAGRPVWDDGPADVFAPLVGDLDADLCVVGLGGSGLACVGEARRLGATVVGLDAGHVGGGAAGRNGGFLLAGLAPFYHDAVGAFGRDAARTLYRLTVQELEHIARESPGIVRRTGSLRIAESPEEIADCAEQLVALHADGFVAESYEGPEGVGLLLPMDGAYQPLARCRMLARAASEAGARLFEHTPALDVHPGRVRTHAGTVRARQVVVAIDGRLELLLPELAPRVRSARLQMLATAPTSAIRLPRPVYARWGYDYWQQRPDGTIALGGGRDRAGPAEWTTRAEPTEAVQRHLERRLRDLLGVDAPITHRWAAIVGYTPDGLPICEQLQAGVWALGGYSGTGNVVGAMLGRGVARQALLGADEAVAALAAARGRGTRRP
jgi:gamma-glutamylputrescine oxidase